MSLKSVSRESGVRLIAIAGLVVALLTSVVVSNFTQNISGQPAKVGDVAPIALAFGLAVMAIASSIWNLPLLTGIGDALRPVDKLSRKRITRRVLRGAAIELSPSERELAQIFASKSRESAFYSFLTLGGVPAVVLLLIASDALAITAESYLIAGVVVLLALWAATVVSGTIEYRNVRRFIAATQLHTEAASPA